MNNLEEFIATLTIMATLLLSLLGFGEDINYKKKILKTILLSYGIVFFLVFTTGQDILIYLLLLNISLFLFGGLTHSTNMELDLEKELSLFRFQLYNSIAWFLTSQNYILLISTLFLWILSLINIILNITLTTSSIFITGLFLISLFIQYLLVIKDYFSLNPFSNVLMQLNKANKEPINMGKPKSNHSVLDDNKKELLSFLIYCEDRNYFERKTCTIGFVDVIMKFKRPSIFKGKINLDNKSKRRVFLRGYSTIEQQLFRQFSMAAYSYRYTIRRKLFNDWIYTPFLFKAICNRKARTYGKTQKKVARKELVGT